MAVIIPFLRSDTSFGPKDILAMSQAFEEACRALNISADASRRRESVAKLIIELARGGERDPARLRDEVLKTRSRAGALR